LVLVKKWVVNALLVFFEWNVNDDGFWVLFALMSERGHEMTCG